MYSTVADVAGRFDPKLWDPALKSPRTDEVTDYLTTASAVLDGEIAHVVSVPVSPSASPNLASVCDEIVKLRVYADIYDRKFAQGGQSTQYQNHPSVVARARADALVKGIQNGAIADGTPSIGANPAAGGGVEFTEGDEPFFGRGDKW